MLNFLINPQMQTKVHYIGHERNMVIQIDNLFEQPDDLVTYACASPEFKPVSDYYPGVRKPLPESYGETLMLAIANPIRTIFNLEQDSILKAIFCELRLTTCEPKELLPIQRIPHFDTSNSNQFAAVLYLCAPHFGGTSLYRHRSTGFETISEKRSITYAKTLEREAHAVGLPNPEYINGHTALFERTASIDALYNRIVIYRSNLLHSGNIQPQHGLSATPDRGRLTANCFITF